VVDAYYASALRAVNLTWADNFSHRGNARPNTSKLLSLRVPAGTWQLEATVNALTRFRHRLFKSISRCR
jgi:hypothetical protein